MKRVVLLPLMFLLIFGLFATRVLGSGSVGEWTIIASMNEERGYGPRAVLLDDGRILVAGGSGQENEPYRSAEIYDPKTNTWKRVADMNHSRRTAMMTKLNDGRVLVAGGYGVDSNGEKRALDSAEIYDPKTNKWTLVANMNESRWSTSGVTLPDGRVLVTGGGDKPSFNSAVNTAEIYDPKTNKWTKVSPMLEKRASHSSVLLEDGRVLVTGGGNKDVPFTDSSEIYDPKTNKWSRVTSMPVAKRTHNMVRLADGRILSVGGYGSEGYLKTTYLYSVNDNSWVSGALLNTERRNPAVSIMADDRVLVAGGRSSTNTYLRSAEIGFFNRAPIVELKSPKNEIVFETNQKNVTLSWSAIELDGDNITRYRLKVRAENGDSNVIEVENNWSTSYTLDLTKLEPNKKYYWTVQARDQHGEWSDWANERTFSIKPEVFNMDVSDIKPFNAVTLQPEPTTYWTSFNRPFSVIDTKREGDGWKIQVQATRFEQVEPKGGFTNGHKPYLLPKGTLKLAGINKVTRLSGQGNLPTIVHSDTKPIDGGEPVTILKADKDTKYGEFEFTFPTNALGLTIDATTAFVDKRHFPNGNTPYRSTITWSLVYAP